MERISILSKRRATYLNINTLYKTFYSDEFNEIRTSRHIAEDAGLYVSKLLFEEHQDVLSGLNHPTLYINPLEGLFIRDIYYDLKTFMFQKTWEKMAGHLPPLTDIVIYIKDLLEGLKYLHDHQIKHMNICPENILITECPDRDSGIAKITGFDFAIKTDQRIVDYQKVGLEWTYRFLGNLTMEKTFPEQPMKCLDNTPPEYYAKGSVDAVAVDYWSVGITAYEILTGGMITIYSETLADRRIHKMIEKEGMLELHFFASAIEASWHYMQLLGEMNNVVKIGGTKYNLSPEGFFKDAWMFVRALMQNNPSQRSTILEALNTPFINPKLKRSFRCHIRFYEDLCIDDNF